MLLLYDAMIADNVKTLKQRIARCCEKAGRHADAVKLICVTKQASIEDIVEVVRLGVTDIGENRVQDALEKYRAIGDKVTWHLIGHLQTNKVKDAVRIFSLIHSVDSVKVAYEIDKEAKKINKVQDVLVQVNTSGEATKYGIAPEAAIDMIKEISSYQNINIKGLMTMAPEVDNPESVRPHFRALRELLDKINERRTTNDERRTLSMGMTNDFEVAIEEGATLVRVGRAIFGARVTGHGSRNANGGAWGTRPETRDTRPEEE